MAMAIITNDWEQFQAAVDNVNYLAARLRTQFMKGTSGGGRGLAGTTGVGIGGNNSGGMSAAARRRTTRKRNARRTGTGSTL